MVSNQMRKKKSMEIRK